MMVTMLQALSHVIYFPVGFATKPLPALGRLAGTPLGSLTLHETMVTMVIMGSLTLHETMVTMVIMSCRHRACHGHHGHDLVMVAIMVVLFAIMVVTGTRVAIMIVMCVLK